MVVQWLRLGPSTVEGMGLIPGWGTKILHAMRHDLPNPYPPQKNERMEKRGILEKLDYITIRHQHLDTKLHFEKAEEPEIKLPTSAG